MGEPGLFLREEDMINGFIAHLQGQNDLPGMVGRYEQDLPAILQGPAGSQMEAKQEEAGWKDLIVDEAPRFVVTDLG